MKKNLSTRLIVRVGVPAALLFGVILTLGAQRSFKRLLQETEHASRLMARQEAARFETALGAATQVAEMIALSVESDAFQTEPALEAYLREAVRRHPEIFGSCLAFEPGTFTPDKRWYAPYFFWKDGQPEFVQLGNPEYDYFHWAWYSTTQSANRPLWSEPYFDEGGGNTIMTTYSVPLRRQGVFRGVATIDIAISTLIARTDRIEVGKSGYAFLVSKKGRFLADATPGRALRGRLQDINPELGQAMMSGAETFLRTSEPVGRRDAWIAIVPVLGGELSLAVVYPASELMGEALGLQAELLVLGVGGLLLLLLAVALIARSISRPIQDLAIAAQEIAAGRLDCKINTGGSIDEVRDLAFAFRKMVRDLQMRMEELRYRTTITERLQGELSGARAIQMSLAPKVFPERPEIDLHAIIRPAREVGGDFYDFHFLDAQRLCVCIGDVSGKGIAAALFMAVTRTLLKSKAGAAPGEVLAQVNREICQSGDTGTFVTLLYGVLDLGTGRFEFCNAGHLPPLLVGALTGKAGAPGCQAGIALGLMLEADYPLNQIQMTPGDTLVLFTDGITEALDPNRDFYDIERLYASLESASKGPVPALTRHVVQEVRNFCAGREQTDDLAVLALRWHGPPAAVPHSENAAPGVERVARVCQTTDPGWTSEVQSGSVAGFQMSPER